MITRMLYNPFTLLSNLKSLISEINNALLRKNNVFFKDGHLIPD
ncbi:hypothetical protein GFK82_00211 [Candidatus Steffania adelgidicola]|nr:hypothetical protein GFK82_00211 [Candidatus Steffania adelgidicola]